MAGEAEAKASLAPEAERALGYLREMSADLRGAAILGGDGQVLACSGDAAAWGEAARELLRVADAVGEESVEQVHVGADEGEVFAVRSGELTAVAVTERFTLASLMLFDMRTVLRDLSQVAA
jgi:predicted regulator of Ras-like GTPase activity (Roadblock/LC7/MglB family)